MNRRNFGHWVTASAALAILSAAPTAFAIPRKRHEQKIVPRLIKPARLNSGDLVGLIAPGGWVDDALIEKSVKNLESFGMRVKVSENIRAVRGGYAGTVEQRADDFHAMFLDRDVKAIWAARGGSGAIQLLPKIDFSLIRKHPKIVVGYSDITALLLAIYRGAGLITFHGPVASSVFSDYSMAQLHAALMEPQSGRVISMASDDNAENNQRAQLEPQFLRRTIREGIAMGRLLGGNLSVLSALIGTSYGVDLSGSLLFLEEISEAPYRVDRMLTQLSQSGGLKKVVGTMLGVFQKCAAPEGEASLTLAEVVDEHFSKLTVPSVYGYPFGHIAQQLTIPVGLRARLDTANASLTLLESPVT